MHQLRLHPRLTDSESTLKQDLQVIHRHIIVWRVLFGTCLAPACLMLIHVCIYLLSSLVVPAKGHQHVIPSVKLLYWRTSWILRGYTSAHLFLNPKRHWHKPQLTLLTGGSADEGHLNWSMALFPPMKICRWKCYTSLVPRPGTNQQLPSWWLASLPSQTVAEPRLLLAKSMAFKALPGQQTCPSISERNSPFLLPSASVGLKGFSLKGQWQFCNPSCQYLSQVWTGYSRVKVLHIHSIEIGHFFPLFRLIFCCRTLNEHHYKHR